MVVNLNYQLFSITYHSHSNPRQIQQGRAQTAVAFTCKTGLTGCFVLARFIRTSVLGQEKKTDIP